MNFIGNHISKQRGVKYLINCEKFYKKILYICHNYKVCFFEFFKTISNTNIFKIKRYEKTTCFFAACHHSYGWI